MRNLSEKEKNPSACLLRTDGLHVYWLELLSKESQALVIIIYQTVVRSWQDLIKATLFC